jgi:DNA-binding response OmpR family regulator
MNALIVDPVSTVHKILAPALSDRKWRVDHARHVYDINDLIMSHPPDLIVVHGDGPIGEAAHLCQRFKQNVLTSGIPIVLIEDAPPPAWMLTGMPADAILQSPWDADEFFHHVDLLLPGHATTRSLDDLTNFPRRASMIDEMQRRMLARELFGVGVLNLREADAYRQDFGRSGLDQFVVLVSVLLRRHAAASTPISVGHLDNGDFLVIGPNSAVQDVIAQTTYEFDALVPAYYEMDTLFGADDSHHAGPSTWIALQGALCLVEPDGFENIWQIGYKLSDTLVAGSDAIELFAVDATPEESSSLITATQA